MKKIAAILVGAMAVMALTVLPAAAQNKHEIAVGFTGENWNGCCAYGFGASYANAFKSTDEKATSFVANVAWNRWSDGEETDLNATAGIRWSFMRSSRVGFYVQGEAGIMHWNEPAMGFFSGASGTDPLFGGGAGLNIRINDMSALRFAWDIWYEDGDIVRQGGIYYVYRFGSK